MSKIKVMDELLANKIAAGEVVESCASVVKELVENSIDAGANEISILLSEGGIKEIKVIDNGSGMDEVDAETAFLPHATSKVYKEDDLYFINTLGFRGEALASIASVSSVNLKTCDSMLGTEINIMGGKMMEKIHCEARIGTTITISNLFYNTPARMKYLKSPKEELAIITNYIEKLALSKPGIKFKLANNGKNVIKTSGSGILNKTIYEIYGYEISSNMLEIAAGNDDYDISGFVCKPSILKSNRNHLITFVNGRLVKNNELNRAINDAYYTYKFDNKYPIAILNIETDPTLIDVNIHPTKQDIKFSKQKELNELVTETIKKALEEGDLIKPISFTDESPTLNIKEEQFDFSSLEIINEPVEKEIVIEESKTEEVISTSEVVKEEVKEKYKPIYPVATVLGTYIVCQNEDGMYLIDQHAAQERINYELYMAALKSKKVSTTSLLIPITIELTKSEFMIIKNNMEILTNMGFVVEEFGINTYVFKEHPTWLLEGYEEESIRKIIDLIIINNEDFDYIKFNESIAITLACKMSIKANEEISIDAMEHIIDKLFKCTNPHNCPHGRPTIIKFTNYELQKMFKRVV